MHYDPLANLTVSNPADCHTYPELKRKLYSALAEGDEGELSIALPKEVALKQSGHAFASGVRSEGAHFASCMARAAYGSFSCDTRATDSWPII